MEHVVLVDEQDNAIGTMEKLEAHKKGLLHRAFSVLVFNSAGEMLIHKRASSKYHSGGLWTNTCCSHPMPEEEMNEATRRRLKYEMGIDLEPVFAFKFIYKAPLDKNLIEHELDHVYVGTYNATPIANPNEVEDWKFVTMAELRADMHANPSKYTVWFKIILDHAAIKERA